MVINYIYKLSDKGRAKPKLDIATKMNCLDNFIEEFKTNITVLADNCEQSTIDQIKMRGLTPIELSLGNSENTRYAMQFAIDNFPKDSYVYFVEDDYVHLPGSLLALQEGLLIADYVSLYDNPDKYVNAKDGGPNPYIVNGGEDSTVMLSKNFHWKTTNSVTMTFAASIKVLEEDKPIWWAFTATKISNSFFAFRVLTRQAFSFSKGSLREYVRSVRRYREFLSIKAQSKQKRILINAIPGLSTHAETAWLTPLTHWHSIKSWEEAGKHHQ